MRYEHSLLRAMVRLAKKGQPATTNNLLDRVGGRPADVRVALRRLERALLVARGADGTARLTLSGLAVAAASAPPAAVAAAPPAPARVVAARRAA